MVKSQPPGDQRPAGGYGAKENEMILNFISFEEWLSRNHDIEPRVTCPDCDGTGEITCDCERCKGHECDECLGEGWVDNQQAREIYDAECYKATVLYGWQEN